jgi:hypothetical protein
VPTVGLRGIGLRVLGWVAVERAAGADQRILFRAGVNPGDHVIGRESLTDDNYRLSRSANVVHASIGRGLRICAHDLTTAGLLAGADYQKRQRQCVSQVSG